MQNSPLDWSHRDEWAIVHRGEAKVPKPSFTGLEMAILHVPCAPRRTDASSELHTGPAFRPCGPPKGRWRADREVGAMGKRRIEGGSAHHQYRTRRPMKDLAEVRARGFQGGPGHHQETGSGHPQLHLKAVLEGKVPAILLLAGPFRRGR